MGNNRFWRFFKRLVCFVLICCILINCSPIKAEAVAVETALGIGLVAILIAASAGVAFHPNTADQVVAIGENMTQELRKWGESNGKTAEAEIWIAGLSIYDYVYGDGGDPEDPRDTQVKLAKALLAGISAWCGSIILGLNEIKQTSVAEQEFLYYNGVLFPTLPVHTFDGTYPYKTIYYYPSSGTYRHIVTSVPLYYDGVTYEDFFTLESGKRSYSYFDAENQSWGSFTSSSTVNGRVTYSTVWPVWTNYDLYRYSDTSELVLAGSEPTSTKEVVISPIYVGDIPQQVQDGEIDEEEIPFPLEIDYSKLFEHTGTTTAQEAVEQTMQQLESGQLSYADYMDMIQTDVSGDVTEPDTDTSTDTWDPPSDPAAFALDLSNYFPFCIPFDLFDFLSCLNADPVAPLIQWEIALPDGGSYPLELDLSPFDSVAKLLRRLQLLLFIVALGIKTRDLIKG